MKKTFLLLSVVLLLIAIPATIILVGQQQEIRKKAAPATTLSFSPASVTKKTGETFALEVTIDTAENQVVAAELHVVYDPTKLEAQTITNSSLFPNILASGVVDRGTATITVGTTDTKKPAKGVGTVAVVRFKALDKTDTPTSVRLAPNTFVGGLGEGATNVLVGTTPANITVTGDGSPIPTPTITPTLTPQPTATASASPSATLTVSTPASGSAMTTLTPTFRGKAEAGAIVTITIYSTPTTVTVTADGSGNWSYTPTAPLQSGSHSVVVSTTSGGKTQTVSSAFVVAAVPTAGASADPIPVSGNAEWTYALLAIGFLLLTTGTAFSRQL